MIDSVFASAPPRRHALVLGAIAAGAIGSLAAPASAFHFATRLIERVGNVDIPLGDTATFTAGSTHRLRIQFGVFDDASGPAPAGGYAGWNVGTMDVTGGGTWTRTPGRLAPFTFFPGPTANGSPTTDPFTSLDLIDNTVGFQALPWFCGPDGQPTPAPQPFVRGRNTFVSTYEVTVQIPLGDAGNTYTVDIAGHLVAIQRWNFDVSLSTPPDCESGEVGTAWYGPITTPDTQTDFATSFTINVIPAPGAAGVLMLGILGVARRRR